MRVLEYEASDSVGARVGTRQATDTVIDHLALAASLASL